MTAIEIRCRSCGGVNAPGSRFCSSCGAPLEETAPPQEERKLVSVLFVDLVDSTARADNADPEDVREVLQAYHREAKRCIEQYGGVVEKFIGDAVMAVLGAIDAKGKADAVEAWLAMEATTAPADRPLGTTPLVGRDRELEVLRSVWSRAVDEKRPHLVTLVGPPGIGKSRLCREIAALVD